MLVYYIMNVNMLYRVMYKMYSSTSASASASASVSVYSATEICLDKLD